MKKTKKIKEPSQACMDVARVLLTPPPEFQAMLHLLRQNTLLLEQTADTLDQLVVVMMASKQYGEKLKGIPELQKKSPKKRKS